MSAREVIAAATNAEGQLRDGGGTAQGLGDTLAEAAGGVKEAFENMGLATVMGHGLVDDIDAVRGLTSGAQEDVEAATAAAATVLSGSAHEEGNMRAAYTAVEVTGEVNDTIGRLRATFINLLGHLSMSEQGLQELVAQVAAAGDAANDSAQASVGAAEAVHTWGAGI